MFVKSAVKQQDLDTVITIKKTYVRSRGKHEDSLLFYTHTFTQRNKFESNKVGTYRNTSLIHKGQRQHLISEKNKGLCNNYLEGGGGVGN